MRLYKSKNVLNSLKNYLNTNAEDYTRIIQNWSLPDGYPGRFVKWQKKAVETKYIQWARMSFKGKFFGSQAHK